MVHLHTHSWFSFLAAASSPQALAKRAAHWEQSALAITDDWTLAGAVQHARVCKIEGIRPIHGARIVIDKAGIVLLAADHEGYANLCDLLTLAHQQRLDPTLTWNDLREHCEGLFCLADFRHLISEGYYLQANQHSTFLRDAFRDRLFIELIHHERAGDIVLNCKLQELAATLEIRCVATNAVRHATPRDYRLYDALVCAQHGITVAQGHSERPVNDAAFLCNKKYFSRARFPQDAIANTDAIARECSVNLLAPEVTPPPALLPDGSNSYGYLKTLCAQGLRRRYAKRNNAAIAQLKKELHIIHHLGLDDFFLVVREVVEFAHNRHIRCSGRGSAANSLVSYLLGITEVDPLKHKLLFERFLHEGRTGMPDIDVDFDTSRRDEVITWMSQRWGEAHTAMTANVVTFRLRMAVREMGKVLGFPLHLLDQTTKLLPHASAKYVREYRSELAEVLGESPALEVLCSLVESLHECPRHLSLHSGGMILSRQPLRYLSPVQTSANGVRQIQFSKDDVERLGLIKFDVLGLRMLATIAEAQSLIHTHTKSTFDVDDLPDDDPATYELIRSGETLGLFQIESPGQWNLLSKVQPEHFDDLVVQVALFRPGPLQGNMVHPYILRRRGKAKVLFAHPSLEQALSDTYGIILYQEQVLEVAHVFAGLSLAEADEFRKLMSKFRDPGQMETMRAKFVSGAIATQQDSPHPVSLALANRIFDTVAKFVGYGFCRSHAAAFARTVYQSAYLKAHYPAHYMAGVLEHQPGFYPMQTLLEEARRLGVAVLPPCLHRSQAKYSLEEAPTFTERSRWDKCNNSGTSTTLSDRNLAIRVPFSQIDGISSETASEIVLERAASPFTSLNDALQRLHLAIDDWENLARAGALISFGDRRKVLWEVRAYIREHYGIKNRRGYNADQLRLDMQSISNAPPLSPLEISQQIQWDFQTQLLTTGQHPLSLHRGELNKLGVSSIATLKEKRKGTVRVAGSVISRQRPPTAKGMCFIILQDETGYLPTAMVPQVYEKYARALRAPQLIVEGDLEDSGVLASNHYRSILIKRLWPLSAICGEAKYGAAGHPGENPRAASAR